MMTKKASVSPAQQNDWAGRVRQSGSSFWLAMRLVAEPARQGLFILYCFCREMDDLADSTSDPAQALAALQRWRMAIARLPQEEPAASAAAGWSAPDRALLSALADSCRRWPLNRDDLLAVIDGMMMDVTGPVCGPALAELLLYCDRVAGAVGRLILAILSRQPSDSVLADHVGRALQFCNIRRDLWEDAALGRLYLAEEWLQQAGIFSRDPRQVLADPGLAAALAPLEAQARADCQAAVIMLGGQFRLWPVALMLGGYIGLLQEPPGQRRSRWKRLADALWFLRVLW